MTNKTKSYLLALTVVLFWSTVASAFKLSLRYLSVIELLLYSTFFSTAALFVILAAQGRIALLKTLTAKDYLFSALLGFLNPFLYYLVIFKAYTLLPAQMAQPLNMIWGIVLVLISIPILKQKVRLIDMLALLVCFAGVVVISTQGNLSGFHIDSPLGVLLAVGSSLIWSFYWVLNVKDKLDGVLRLFLNFVFGFGFILLSIIFIYPIRSPASVVEGILGAFYIGLFEMGLAFALWVRALKLADATVNIAILIYIVPFISFIFIHIFVGERIHLSSVLGATLIVAGILLNKYTKKR
ncbi:MAG: DMT family transporter [Candidatus Aminicenantes bacterium]|nr:DMT family transporter [Candidatus Aminicenantes bacterium]